ncbi:MAG TPA: integrase arm-type DNA-binding domain-containing protein [Acidobacteriaceae bacterium]|nr:integrase arm-type DNA-binding domain-containing protein [Acidobacteriaceae bacterium]
MALTDTAVRKAKTKDTAYRLSDGGGLYLWITPAGGKLWRWKYRCEGKEKLMSFGSYPDVSLSLARERHIEARKLLASGVDPMAQRKADKATAENSFQSVSLRWLEHWRYGKSPRHVDYVMRRMEANIQPSLGARPIAEIEAPELVAMAKAIEKRGARDIAKRALETTGQVFRYAIAHGYTKRNPASEIRPSDILKSTRKANYARIDARDLPGLLRSIEVYPGTHVTRLALKLMAFTFVRTSELIGARWAEFDIEAARWNIPAERMKMRTPHIVPLAKQTLDVLDTLRTLTGGNKWLFPGDRNAKKPMSNNTILKALERMGYKGQMTGHGFRGLASTILHEQGYAHEHIELQLAHAPRNAVSAAYNHALYLEPRARMMQDWADFLEQTQRGGKVPFRGSAA